VGVPIGYQVSTDGAGGRLDWDIAMPAAEDDDFDAPWAASHSVVAFSIKVSRIGCRCLAGPV
jgi:hypothetical protein